MKAYCSFCRDEKGPLIAAPAGEIAFICCKCAESCIVLFIENLQRQKDSNKNGRIAKV